MKHATVAEATTYAGATSFRTISIKLPGRVVNVEGEHNNNIVIEVPAVPGTVIDAKKLREHTQVLSAREFDELIDRLTMAVTREIIKANILIQ